MLSWYAKCYSDNTFDSKLNVICLLIIFFFFFKQLNVIFDVLLDIYRDLSEFSMGMNGPPPIMSREEFEARKADLRRKRENERRGER